MDARLRRTIELNFWVMPNAGFATRAVLQPLVDEFEAERPDVRVRLTFHPWSLAWTRLMDVIKGRGVKAVPDVLQVGTTWLATIAYLDALDEAPADLRAPYDNPGATGMIGDYSPYGLPWFVDIRALYYRRDLFEALHLDPALLNDWRGFYRACGEIQKNLGRLPRFRSIVAPLAMPGQKPAVLMHDIAPWIWDAGGDFCSDDLRDVNLVQPALIQGCEFYFDLIDLGYMPIPNSALPSGNFFTGRYAMQFSGSWPIDTYLNPRSPEAHADVAEGTSVAALPAGPAGRTTFLGGSNLSVSSFSEQKEAAWDFVRFLMAPGRLLRHARGIGALPPRLAEMDALFRGHPRAKDVFFSSLGHGRRLPRIVELGSVEQIILKLGGRVLSLIREREYNHRRLQQEIHSANNDIRALLSMHRYNAPQPGPER